MTRKLTPEEMRERSIKCSHCDSGHLTSTVDTRRTVRYNIAMIKRRRVCDTCHKRTTTLEMPEDRFMHQNERQLAAQTLIDMVEHNLIQRIRG